MKGEAARSEASSKQRKRWLGSHPFRTILRISAALGGAALIAGGLGVIWPEPDPMAETPPTADDPTSLAPLPKQPVMVLVVGLDSDGLNDPNNRAAPRGLANADSLMLLNVSADAPLQVLQLPTELAVNLPGQDALQPLSAAYRQGDVSLTADVVTEVLGLDPGELNRYVIMPREALRTLVDGLGEVDVTLTQTYSRKDLAQNYSVNLQAGRQSLNGQQAEQLARHKPSPGDEENRRRRQQTLLSGIHDQLNQPNAITLLPTVIGAVSLQIETDLTSSEMLSLAAAVLSNEQAPVISQLELAPRAGQQLLRELKPDQPLPLWPLPANEGAGN